MTNDTDQFQFSLFDIIQVGQTKTCNSCHKTLPLDDFHANPGNKTDGRQPRCRKCSTIKVQEWRAKNANRTSYTCEECGTTGTTPNPVPPRTCQPCQRIAAAKAAGKRHVTAAQDRAAEHQQICGHPECDNTIDYNSRNSMFCSAECRSWLHEQWKSPLRKAIEANDYSAMTAVLLERTTPAQLPGINTPCWEWPATDKDGYTTVRWTSTPLYRLVVEVKYGKPLGTQAAHHACANRACVNPDHLQPVTHAENTAEMLARQSFLKCIADLKAVVAELAPNHPILDVIELR